MLTATAIRTAQRTLAEIAQREHADAAHAAEEARAAEVGRWAADEQTADTGRDSTVDDADVLDRAGAW